MPKENQACATPFRTMIGGQALIEGIMMLGPDQKSIVVRRPDGGLEIKTEQRRLIKDRHPVLGWPFVRGVVNFCTSMYTGVTALMYSAEFFPEDRESGEEEEESKLEQWLEQHLGSEKATSVITTPDRSVGSTKKSPTEKAIPMMTARVVKKAMAFSLPSFSSSHCSNLEGSSSSSPSSG